MTTSVKFRGFSESITLESVLGGGIVSGFLRGPFRFRLTFYVKTQGTVQELSVLTEPFTVHEAHAAKVSTGTGEIILDSLKRPVRGDFLTSCKLRENLASHWIGFRGISVDSFSSQDEVDLRLRDIVVSLIPDIEEIPRSSGDSECLLAYVPNSESPMVAKIALRYNGDGKGLPVALNANQLQLLWNSNSKDYSVGWGSGFSISVGGEAAAQLGSSDREHAEFAIVTSGKVGSSLSFVRESGAEITKSGPAGGSLEFGTLICRRGTFRVFRNTKRREIAKTFRGIDPASKTALLTGPNQCEFVMPMGTMAGLGNGDRAALIRRKSLGSLAATPTEREEGLRVAGISNDSGTQASFDADLAVLEFVPNGSNNREFHLRAGGEIDVPFEGRMSSRMVPKTYAAEGVNERRIRIPSGQLLIESRCQTLEPKSTSFELDTGGGLNIERYGTAVLHGFVIRQGTLLMNPVGTKGGSGASSLKKSRSGTDLWDWSVLGGMGFSFSRGVLFPSDGDQWTQVFRAQSGEFPLKEYPGAIVRFPAGTAQGEVGTFRAGMNHYEALAAKEEQRIGFLFEDGLEIPRYEALHMQMTYGPEYGSPDALRLGSAQVFVDDKDVSWMLPSLIPAKGGLTGQLSVADGGAYIAANGVDDLLIAWCRDQGIGDSRPLGSGFSKFVDHLFFKKDPDQRRECLWGIGIPTLGLVMRIIDENGRLSYGDQIAIDKWGTEKANPVLINDVSTPSSILNSNDWLSGKHAGTFKDNISGWQKDYPLLWAKSDGKDNAALDPSTPAWRGVLYSGFPAAFQLSTETAKDWPFLEELFRKINSNLLVKFGWKDGEGNTWAAEVDSDSKIIELTPDKWKTVLRIQLAGFNAQMRKNKVVLASGTLRICFPFFQETGTSDDKLRWFDADFVVNLASNTVTLDQIVVDLSKSHVEIPTRLIPGFEKIQIRKFSTDLKTLDATFRLIPSDDLLGSLPFMSKEDGLEVKLHLLLSPDIDDSKLSFGLPNTIDFNIFGRWHMTLEGLLVTFAKESNNLTGRGSLILGGAEFLKVGGAFLIGQSKMNGSPQGDWTFDTTIDNAAVKLGLGGMNAEIALGWADPSTNWAEHETPPPSSPVGKGELKAAGDNREFLGVLRLSSDGVFKGKKEEQEKLLLAVRFGNYKGQNPFWIAALRYKGDIGFGPSASFGDPMLIVGRGVDAGKNLENAVTQAEPRKFKTFLRPKNDIGAWLAKTWSPSDQTGLVLALSAYLGLDSSVAKKPKEEKHLTSLFFSESGLFRIDAFLKIFGSYEVEVGIGLDTQCKFLSFQIQAPTIEIPPGTKEFILHGGLLQIGFRYGKSDLQRCKDHPIFRLAMGWPEQVGNDEFERNWDQAIRVTWDQLWPINTLWGGMLVSAGEDYIIHGQAGKAGWTKSYDFLGGIGSAYLEVSVGGMIIYKHSLQSPSSLVDWTLIDCRYNTLLLNVARSIPALRHNAPQGRTLVDRRKECLSIIHNELQQKLLVESASSCLEGRLFLDIKGGASVTIFGIELASVHIHAYARAIVCGTIDWSSMDIRIKKVGAKLGFVFSVKIGCYSYSAKGSLPIWLKNEDCGCERTLDSILTPRLMDDVGRRLLEA